MVTIDGPDVSSFQPNFKPSVGDDFVFIKASQGKSYKNPERSKQETAARKAGLVVGWYHFQDGISTVDELHNFAAAANVEPGDLIVLDWESSGASAAEKDDLLKRLKGRFPNNKVGLYCNTSYWLTKDTTNYFQDFLWIAWYNSTQPPIQTPWTFWQYTDKPIDRSRSIFQTKADLKAWAEGKVVPTVINTQAKVAFRGGWTCGCVATSLPLVEQDMIKAGIIKQSIDLYQLGYRDDVEASAGTHSKGGCTDVAQYSDAALKIWRKWGWTTQHRTKAQGFDMDHGHGFPYGCPHLADAAKYQVTDWRNRMNGLTGRVRGKVTGPGWQVLDWKDAIKAHAGTTPKPTPEPEPEKGVAVSKPPTKYHRTKDHKVPAGKWVSLPIEDSDPTKYSLGSGPGTFDVVANITADKTVLARFVTMNYKAGKVQIITRYPEVEIPDGKGQISLWDTIGGPSKGWTSKIVRLQVCAPKGGATIKDVFIRTTKD